MQIDAKQSQSVDLVNIKVQGLSKKIAGILFFWGKKAKHLTIPIKINKKISYNTQINPLNQDKRIYLLSTCP